MSNYNIALEKLTNKEIERSGRLSQLLTYTTITHAKIMYKSPMAEIQQEIIDKMIGEEIQSIINGVMNVEYDGGEMNDYDFFIEHIVNPLIGTTRKIEATKPVWGQEDVVEVKEVKAVEIKNPSDTFNAQAILKYANGAQITKMLNAIGSDLVSLKPYDKLTFDQCKDVLCTVQQKATKEKQALIKKFLSDWGL